MPTRPPPRDEPPLDERLALAPHEAAAHGPLVVVNVVAPVSALAVVSATQHGSSSSSSALNIGMEKPRTQRTDDECLQREMFMKQQEEEQQRLQKQGGLVEQVFEEKKKAHKRKTTRWEGRSFSLG